MLNSVKRSLVFSEFTEKEQNYWFSIKEKAVSHHIDTLYYSVFIDGDMVDPTPDTYTGESLLGFLEDMTMLKQRVQLDPVAKIQYYGLDVERSGAAIGGGLYAFHLSLKDHYDIFISPYIPTDKTPRIQVQIRTNSLVLDGLYEALHKSFDKVCSILSHYGLAVSDVRENRIDYAFHTNVVQKPAEVFSDENLKKHLDTTFRELYKHVWLTGKRDDFFDLDYFSLGSRRSNNVFFRVYNKTKEVVQMNYKGFFFEVWFERGLISRYDLYVMKEAYTRNSYKTGVSVGRINWYLEYGKNKDLKAELRKLLESCDLKSDNNPFMEKKIKGVLPPITTIMNFEFETKRKFYVDMDLSNTKVRRFASEPIPYYKRPELYRLYVLFEERRAIFNVLLRERVVFREDNFDISSPMLDFWARIARCKVGQIDYDRKAVWEYSRNLDMEKTKRRLCNSLAQLSMLKKNSVNPSELGDDIWLAASLLNDNDIENYQSEARKVFGNMSSKKYAGIRQRKARQLRSYIKNSGDDSED